VVRVPCNADGQTIEKVLAFAVDCHSRMCELDPYVGGAMAVAEVCRNIVCSGAQPIGLTDCLNFGNPERPEVMDSLARAIDGIAAACRALDVPVVSGNVSLYNETQVLTAGRAPTSRAILPTPTVAAVGLATSYADIMTADFKGPGDVVLLLGDPAGGGPRGLTGSEWLVGRSGRLVGEVPDLDLAAEASLQALVLQLARARRLESAHDVSDGGLAVALAECCTVGRHPIGARIELRTAPSSLDALATLFGEAPSRVVVSVAPSAADAVLDCAHAAGVPVVRLGETGGDGLAISIFPLGALSVPLTAIEAARNGCLEAIVGS
jgi:phosphoribosylformylglycinamidine synthase